MRIVRPKQIKSTPNALGLQMGAEVITRDDSPDWKKDFFMFYPEPFEVVGRNETYHRLREFYSQDKYAQRTMLSYYTPNVLTSVKTYRAARDLRKLSEFIVRPLHHEKGAGFRVTDDALDFDEGNEYITPIFPKTHEYRIVFVCGGLAFIQMKDGGKLGYKDCWSNVPFVIVRDHARWRMRGTDVLAVLSEIPVIRDASIVGVDVLWNQPDQTYKICEVNTCPSLLAPTLEEGRYLRQRVIERIANV